MVNTLYAKVEIFNFSSFEVNYMDALMNNTMTKTIVLAFNQYHVVSSIGPLGSSYYGSDGGIYFSNSTAGYERNLGNPFEGGSNASGGGESSWASDIWNSTIVRTYTGDAIFVNSTFSLVFLGGGSNATGFVLPLRGPDAFNLNFINTASFRLGAQGGWDVSAGKMWFNGPAESAYVREMNDYGASLDVNLGLALGWGPGLGVFESHNHTGKTTWFGAYGSFGFGIGGSLGFDYTYTTPVFRR
ncbi:MAG: hypothetical protein RBS07_15365 [Lentimicrobium sp.]|nr:hypothetical protein [Lentimicrobium sp.]